MADHRENQHRRSIRLKNWDYASSGGYFVTICVEGRECCLGDIVDAEMQLNKFGTIILDYWRSLPRHFYNVGLDEFAIMPNHVHFVLFLNTHGEAKSVGAQFNCAPTTANQSPIGQRFTVDKNQPTLGQVVRTFKAATTRLIRQAGSDGFAWQRNYYEHIIRDEPDLDRVRNYILNNPANWAHDAENTAPPR